MAKICAQKTKKKDGWPVDSKVVTKMKSTAVPRCALDYFFNFNIPVNKDPIETLHCTQKMKFSIKMWPNSPETAYLVTYNEGIFNGKLHFLCSDSCFYI